MSDLPHGHEMHVGYMCKDCNPPSQAEKLKQELRRRVIQGVSGMQTRAYSHTEATNEIMTAIADYISGIELPEKHTGLETFDSPASYHDDGYNQYADEVRAKLKDIEKEIRK